MKLTLELFRYGPDDGLKSGRLSLLVRTDLPNNLHADVIADDRDRFDLDTLSALIDTLKRRDSIIKHLIGEERAG